VLQLILGALIVGRVVRLIILIARGVTDSRLALSGLIVQLIGTICFAPFVILLSLILVLPGWVIWLSLVPGVLISIIGVTLWIIGRRIEREPVVPGPTPEQQRAIDDDMWGWEPNAEGLRKPN